MLEQILGNPDLIFYVLAAEGLFFCLLQLRTNHLLRRSFQVRAKKKETIRQIKEEIKNGESKIPVVKFEKQKEKLPEAKKQDQTGKIDTKELEVLQEMMTEFFG